MNKSNPGLTRRRVEMEHALKAAYTLQNEGRAWHSVELARFLSFPGALAENIAHGHAIPASGSHLPSPAGRSLLKAAIPGARLCIVRLDDEPEPLLTQLVALGLAPGINVEILVLGSDILRLRLADTIVPLSYGAAAHVFVAQKQLF